MNVVLRNMTFDYFDVHRLAYFTYQFAQPNTYRTGKKRLAILGNPGYMILSYKEWDVLR